MRKHLWSTVAMLVMVILAFGSVKDEEKESDVRIEDVKPSGEPKNVGKPDPKLSKKSNEEVKKSQSEPLWATPDQVVTLGDLQISIPRAVIRYVTLRDKLTGSIYYYKSNSLCIEIKISNTNKTKRIRYSTWRDDATLKDNFGNKYARRDLEGYTLLGGYPTVESAININPETSVSDILLFEEPIDRADHLLLEMPASNCGYRGMVRFKIPMQFITKR